MQLVPTELQQKWQKDLESIDSQLGGTAEKPISSLLIMLETPEEMVVLCTTGECLSGYVPQHAGINTDCGGGSTTIMRGHS